MGIEIALIAAAVLGTGATVRGQNLAGKARKGQREQVDADKKTLEGKRKDALIGREQSLSKNIATSSTAGGGATSTAGGSGGRAGQTLGNDQLRKRILG